MNYKNNDTDLREALKRKYSDTPQLPADFMASMKQKMEQGGAAGGSSVGSGGKTTGSKRIQLWRWVAAAACLLIVIGIGVTMMPDGEQPGKPLMAQTEQPKAKQQEPQSDDKISTSPTDQESAPDEPKVRSLRTPVMMAKKTDTDKKKENKKQQPAPVAKPIRPLLMNPNIHYASHETEDTVPYQAPSRVDDFINRIAEYNNVQAEPLQCSSDKGIDSSIVSKAYLFEDTKELDLFGRLLQVACWYNNKAPGYLLNFTRKQFVFCLEDQRMGQKYLWVAERLSGNHILLFSTHSPIETVVSSTCFQDYRDQLTHKGINILQF